LFDSVLQAIPRFVGSQNKNKENSLASGGGSKLAITPKALQIATPKTGSIAGSTPASRIPVSNVRRGKLRFSDVADKKSIAELDEFNAGCIDRVLAVHCRC
jgi:hypothetical protein